MARKYSRRKGKSGSKKLYKKTIPKWERYKEKEIELLIVKLAKEGKSASQIGLHLRDIYGVPDVKLITKKKIGDILKQNNVLPEIPEDLMALMKKAVHIKKHLEQNKKDMTALRGMQLTESKINSLIKFYKKNSRLPENWKYDLDKTKLLVE